MSVGIADRSLAFGRDETVDVLRRSPFLAGFGEPVLSVLSRNCREERFDAGDRVIQKGDAGSTMYFIVDGDLRVHDDETLLATLGTGDVFGEMALLDSEVRSASVTAETPSRLLSLERDAFYSALRRKPESFEALIAAIIRRERQIVADVTEKSERLHAYQKELEIGRKIQADFLPETIPEISGWSIATYFQAAREVAGDFYDLYELDEGRKCGFVVGDVCDKGVGAALFMTLFRSLLRSSCMQEHAELCRSRFSGNEAAETLIRTVSSINRYIATTHQKSGMFATMFLGILDVRTGRLDYVNAGHESPILVRRGGALERFEVTGGVVGLFDPAKFRTGGAVLEAGDLLFVYTDGVNEAKNPGDEQFTDQRIVDAGLRPGVSAGDAVERVKLGLERFRREADQSDDITMIALTRDT